MASRNRALIVAVAATFGLIAACSTSPTDFAQGTWTCTHRAITDVIEIGDGVWSQADPGGEPWRTGTWSLQGGQLTVDYEGHSNQHTVAGVPDRIGSDPVAIMWVDGSRADDVRISRDGNRVTIENRTASGDVHRVSCQK